MPDRQVLISAERPRGGYGELLHLSGSQRSIVPIPGSPHVVENAVGNSLALETAAWLLGRPSPAPFRLAAWRSRPLILVDREEPSRPRRRADHPETPSEAVLLTVVCGTRTNRVDRYQSEPVARPPHAGRPCR